MVLTSRLFTDIHNCSVDNIIGDLKENNIHLDKSDYFYLREHVIPEYEKKIIQQKKQGKISKEKFDLISKELTGFIRHQHYSALENELRAKRKNNCPLNSFNNFSEVHDDYVESEQDNSVNEEYNSNWRKTDDVLYALERTLWKGDILENKGIKVSHDKEDEAFANLCPENRNYKYREMSEQELIEKIPTKGYSKYGIKLVKMMKEKTFYPEKFVHSIRNYFSKSA